MALPKVKITRKKNNLKRTKPTDDNVFGLAVSGVAVVGKIALGEPKLITGLDDLTTLGIVEGTNPLAVKEVTAFYAKAGEGTELYLMLYSSATLLADLCDKDAGTLRNIMSVGGGRVRYLFVAKTLPGGYAVDLVDGLDADVWDAVVAAQAFCEAWGESNDPVGIVLPGIGFAKANIANLRDLSTMTANQVSILLGADDATGKFAIGTIAGWLSKLPVHRNAGRVLDGSVLEGAWLGDGTVADAEEIKGYLDGVHDKRYIIFRKHKGKSGYFFNDDPTACSIADDYSSISWNRTINKAHVIAYNRLVDHLNDDVETEPSTGAISPATASDWEGEVERDITVLMIRKGNLTAVKCVIDPSAVSISQDEINADLTVVRKGQSKTIGVSIGFAETI